MNTRFFIFIVCLIFTASIVQAQSDAFNIATGRIDWTPNNSPGLMESQFNCNTIITGSHALNITGVPDGVYPVCSPASGFTVTLTDGATFNGSTPNDVVSGILEGSFSYTMNPAKTQIVAVQTSPLQLNFFGSLQEIFEYSVMTPLGTTPNFTITVMINVGNPNSPSGCASNLNTATGDDVEVTTGETFCVVPINLSSFNAKQLDGELKSYLFWTSESEENSSHYEIQRSNDLVEFIPIGKLSSFNKPNSYKFIDDRPTLGLNYYRLKMVDLDGTFKFSNVEVVSFKNVERKVVAYPNPFQEILRLEGIRDGESYRVLDIYGKTVITGGKGNGDRVDMDFSNMNDGVYLIEIGNASERKYQKVIKAN